MKKRTLQILEALDAQYGREYVCYLNHENAWQLLIATMLSAQCTDARVNIVTKDLFQKYRSVEDFAKADLKELEKDIHSTGFYHNKAKNIIACCKQLLERHGGEVPSSIEELTELAGVGRKTANVIRGNIFHEPSIVVDTHVKRISKRLGLSDEILSDAKSFIAHEQVKFEDVISELQKDKQSQNNYILYKDENGNEVPLVVTEIMPSVKGVVVGCENGENEFVCATVKSLVTTALDISDDKVCVVGLDICN